MGGRFCGETTVSKPDRTREVTKHENKVIVGSRTIKISGINNISSKPGTKVGVIVIDDEKWPRVRSFYLGGSEQ
jgi:hypothetical protein